MNIIDAEKIKGEIDKIIDGLKKNCTPNPLGTMVECLADAEITALSLVKDTIDEMKQDVKSVDGVYIRRNRYTKQNVLNGLSVTYEALQSFKDGDRIKVVFIKEASQ